VSASHVLAGSKFSVAEAIAALGSGKLYFVGVMCENGHRAEVRVTKTQPTDESLAGILDYVWCSQCLEMKQISHLEDVTPRVVGNPPNRQKVVTSFGRRSSRVVR
jgi:hypothetical protein